MLTAEELQRYRRHIVLPEIGHAGQERLRRSSALIVGAGGLGNPAALYLAAGGVGRLGIVDSDTVDESNLQRQIAFSESDRGSGKAAALTQRLRSLNSLISVEALDLRLTGGNARSLVRAYDIVLDASDNFDTRYVVSDACVAEGKQDVYGSIHRFEGHASVFNSGASGCYRCLYPAAPPPDLVPSCEEAGVLGVLPGIIGTIQAAEALKILLGIGTSLAGRLLIFDGLAMSFREVRFTRNPECGCAASEGGGRRQLAKEGGAVLETMSPKQLRDALAARAIRLVDVREENEWATGHLPGAELMPLSRFTSELSRLGKEEEIVFYCAVGARSANAAAYAKREGFSAVANLAGGIARWRSEGGDVSFD